MAASCCPYSTLKLVPQHWFDSVLCIRVSEMELVNLGLTGTWMEECCSYVTSRKCVTYAVL